MKPPARIRLRLLGRLALARDDDPAPIRLSTRKAGALIAFVAMAPEQLATREQLAAFLWGGCTDQQARQSLRQALALLRKDLGSTHLLATDTEVVRLQPGVWSVDARDFDALTKSSDPNDLDRAARLFGGEFLSGLNIEEEGFEEWVREQRQRMQLAAARLCETFAARPDLVIDTAQALNVAEQLLAIDPLREDWQRIALTLYARYRGRNEALAQADAFADVLQRELGSGPERETQDLVERIRAGEIAAANPTPARPDEPAGEAGPVPAARPRPVRWRTIAAVLAVIALAGGGMFALIRPNPPADAPVSVASSVPPQPAHEDDWRSPSLAGATRRDRMLKSIVPIAVLPFTAVGDTSASAQLIADMMTDDLINVMSRVPSFRVISRRTTSRYQGVDVATVGAELQVKYVLEGSIRAQDGGLRVNLQLIDPATRLPLWSGRVERADADRHAVRDEIVAGIARQLQIEIIPIEGERRSADQTADADAYLGWSAMQAGFAQTGIDHYRRAEAHFRKALERDPQHLSARIGVGAFHANVGAQRLDTETAEHFRKAREILTEVIQRHPDNATALFQLGILTQSTPGPGQIKQGLALFERVVDLNPSNAGAHAHIGHALARTGQAEKGIEHVRYAMRLSPKDPSLAIWQEFIGNAQLELAQYAPAAESFRASAALAPEYPRPWAGLAAAHALAGDDAAMKGPLDRLKALAQDANAEALLKRFGRNPKSRLHEGLRLALTPRADPWQPPAPGAAAAGNIVPLVILPFKTYGEDQIGALADMVTDDLTNMLSRVQSFRVISRQTARAYRNEAADVASLGSALHVRYVLEGSMRVQNDRLRVNVELIDPATRLPAWTGRIERDRGDRIGIVDEIVTQLARELQFELINIESERRSNDPDTDALIYRGWAAMYDIGLDSYRKAETYFREALARDPDSLSAQIGMGAFHARIGALVLDAEPLAHRAKAQQILEEALRRNPYSSAANFYLGLATNLDATLPRAIELFKRSIDLNPSFPSAHAHVGHALVRTGHPAEGLPYIKYAMRLSPRDPTMTVFLEMAGHAELELNHHAAAIESFERAAALKPAYPRPWAGLAAAHALAGRMDEARDYARKLIALQPHLGTDALIGQFGRTAGSQLRTGLSLALAPASAPAADSWKSPPLTPERHGANTRPVIALAVLPFTAIGEDTALRMTADIITEDLTNGLSRVSLLRVISRQTMRSYAGGKIDVAAIGAELGVRYVLEGALRMQGDRLRVHVELIDPATRLPVWSARIERDSADQYQVHDEIVGRLARELEFEIYHAEADRPSKDPTFNQLIYRGWAAVLDHGTEGITALKRAEAAFVEADAREPGNKASRFGLGAYHTLVGSLQLVTDWREHLVKAEQLLRRNIKDGPDTAGQHFYLSIVQRMRGDLGPALESLRHCLEIAPSMAPCHAHVGHTLVQMNRAVEGLAHVDYALRLSPRDLSRPYWLRFAGEAEIEMGHFDRATALLRQSYAANPHHPFLLRSLAAASALSGNVDESRKYIAELGTVAPHLSIERYLNRPAPLRAAQPELSRGLRMALAPRM